MLFDLRSKGRRRTVQVVYLGLAILIGGGLVLFGVGTGSGNGGLLNAFGGGSNNQSSLINSAEKTALKQTQKDPSSPAAWAALETARYQNASSSGFNSNTGTYTTAGKKELAKATDAWQKYASLTKSPSNNLAIFAGNAYAALGQYANAAAAWEAATQSDASSVKSFECLAMTAYAAQQTRKGDLAATKAASMVPKASRKQLTSQIDLAKTQPTAAQEAC
jgi:tetratricopeptide (TPR) repeat protein